MDAQYAATQLPATRPPRTAARIGWGVMTFAAVGVAGYAAALLLFPALRNSFVDALFANLPAAAAAHLGGGAVALVCGALQLNSRLRVRYVAAHRWAGRLYLLAVLTGGIGGLVLATESTGGPVTHAGFGLLAVLWLASTFAAWRHVRGRRIAEHRAWMLRSYALTLAAVTLRIYLPASQVAGIEFVSAYQAIAWLCWVPNLVVVEWFLLGKRKLSLHREHDDFKVRRMMRPVYSEEGWRAREDSNL